jgi:threonine dehydrogenase-like Zn-dependent dehydrogenase
MGHEAIGIVEEVGSEVRTLKKGDLVVMPFAFSDGTCVFCHEGLHTACLHGGFFGNRGMEVRRPRRFASRGPMAHCLCCP